MRIVFDLDGTICKPKTNLSDDYYTLEPFPEAVETLQRLDSEGHHIIIHTARGMKTYDENIDDIYDHHYYPIMRWLTQWNIPCNELILGKPLADLYIDDKGVFHKDWLNTNVVIKDELWKEELNNRPHGEINNVK